jgi:hypothetical protein
MYLVVNFVWNSILSIFLLDPQNLPLHIELDVLLYISQVVYNWLVIG